MKKIISIIVGLLVVCLCIAACYHSSNRVTDFETYKETYEKINNIITNDFEKRNINDIVYIVDDKNESILSSVNGKTELVYTDTDGLIQSMQSCLPYKIDYIKLSNNEIIYSYGEGISYIIYTSNDSEPDYSFSDKTKTSFSMEKLDYCWYYIHLNVR